LVRQGYFVEDPLENIKTPKAPRRFPFVLSEEELSELLKVAKRTRDHATVLLLIDAGLRAGELITLKLYDPDLKRLSALL